jgi:hypothetical protein
MMIAGLGRQPGQGFVPMEAAAVLDQRRAFGLSVGFGLLGDIFSSPPPGVACSGRG